LKPLPQENDLQALQLAIEKGIAEGETDATLLEGEE
jgi:hypothetical protein